MKTDVVGGPNEEELNVFNIDPRERPPAFKPQHELENKYEVTLEIKLTVQSRNMGAVHGKVTDKLVDLFLRDELLLNNYEFESIVCTQRNVDPL